MVEFTKEHPLLVIVGKIKRKWNIQTSTKDRFTDGKIYADKIVERLQTMSPGFSAFTENWRQRRIVGAPPGPPFVVAPKLHHPAVVWHLEYVRYQCDHPFILTAHRDYHVTPDLRSPDSPYGWKKVQEAERDGSHYVVIGRAQADCQYQRFYKSLGWIYPPGGPPVLVDPDIVIL